MRGFSKAIITGNLTRDPELRTTTSGSNVCSFSVAVNRTYKGADGENKEDVSYIDCVAWGKLGEVISNYAKKGSSVLVSGRLSQRSFEGKDGIKRSRTEVVAEDFNFIGSNPASRGASASEAGADEAPVDIPTDIPEGEVDLSEIPF